MTLGTLRRVVRHASSARTIDAALVIACITQLIVLLVRPPLGVFSIDEVTQLAMLRALVHDHSLFFAATAPLSAESAYAMVRPYGGHLAAQYPHGFALLSAPIYAVVGARAPVAMNTLAFYATTALVARLSRTLFRSGVTAAFAALMFALATFAWEYSVAIWPHAVTVFTTTLAVYCAVRAALADNPRRTTLLALAAGACIGVGTTFRLDAVFMVAPVMIALGAIAPSRKRAALIVPFGMIPALAFLSWTNHVKFGTWSPLSYGPEPPGARTSLGAFLPVAVGAVIALTVALAWFSRRRTVAVNAATFAIVAAAAIVWPSSRHALVRAVHGALMLGVDLRMQDPGNVEAALVHGVTNAMIYGGTVKKSLLQSLPYLPAIPLGVAFVARHARRRAAAIAAAALVPFAVFAALEWHGGMSFNLRYLLVALPYLAILGAVALRKLLALAGASVRRSVDQIALAATFAYLAFVVTMRPTVSRTVLRERFYLDVPLLVAALVALTVIAVARLRGRGRERERERERRRTFAGWALVATTIGIVWAGMTAFTYDALASLHRRAYNARVGAAVRGVVPPRALLFVDIPDAFASELDDGVELAVPWLDDGADFRSLGMRAVCNGRDAFAACSPIASDGLASLAARAQLRLVPVKQTDDVALFRIALPPDACAGR